MRSSSTSVSIGAGCPYGATPPIAWPVTSRTVAARARSTPRAASSTLLAPEQSTSTGRPSRRNTNDLTIAPTSTPIAAAACSAVCAGSSNSRTFSYDKALRGRGRHAPRDLLVGQREVAGGDVAAVLALEVGVDDVAGPLHELRAARVEAAGARRVGRRRHVATQHLAVLVARQPRVRDRH